MVRYSTQQIKELIIQEALKQNIDPALVLAVAEHESGFNPNAKNFTNAEKSYGLFQINTKAHPAYKGGFDVNQNIQYGVGIFKDALKKANGDPYKAFAIYNGGIGGQKASIRNGYPQAVTKLVDKHRNNTVLNSNAIKNKAQEVRMNNKVNGSPLEGQVSETEYISPTSANGLKNILEGVESGTRKTEQRFRETINPQQKDDLIRQLFATGFRPDILARYIENGGSLATLKVSLQQAGVIGDKAPWEEGGTPIEPISEGLRRRQALESIAYQRAQDELNLINQMQDPVAKAQREQGMKDMLNNSFARYNQMVDNLQDPRLQNTGYQLSPRELEAGLRGQGMMALLGMTNNAPTAQQIAQARYENQIANQYGVPYQQVLDAQMSKFNMKAQLMQAQIEEDYKQQLANANSNADIVKAQQDRINNYYDWQKEALRAQSDYEDLTTKGYQGIVQAGVAPTISGSAGIYEKGLGISGDILGREVQSGIDLQLQAQKDREQAIRERNEQESKMAIEQIKLNDPYERAQKFGRGVEGFAASQGFNPVNFNSAIMYTPFGSTFFPTGAPPTNPNAANNINGGLRIPTNNELYNNLNR